MFVTGDMMSTDNEPVPKFDLHILHSGVALPSVASSIFQPDTESRRQIVFHQNTG